MGQFMYFLIYVLSIFFSGLVGVGILTYVLRTWQLFRADQDGSTQQQILHGVDQIQTRLDLVSERLERVELVLEEGLHAGSEVKRLESVTEKTEPI